MYQDESVHEYTHLVVLCCHAVYHGQPDSDPRQEDHWALKPFQRSTATKAGEHETFLQHAFAAVQHQKANTLIAFSGGPTNEAHPDLSEARSYLNAIQDWGAKIDYTPPPLLADTILLEEAATDSYQNVLFSILLFRRRTGYYPRHITVITHAFKISRFLDLHARALKWPLSRITVLGINPPFTREELNFTTIGEERNGHGPWEMDLYGTGPVLSQKRKVRGWREEKSEALSQNLEIVVQRLLKFGGTAEVFPETLPWE